jgi:hypothetical protein
VAPAPDRLSALALERPQTPSWLTEPEQSGGMTIGGAFRGTDWAVGGAYERNDFIGEPADLVAGSVGYGPLVASLAYGEAERADEPPLDVLMLSTDLEAWSWLTVESDMALGSDGEEESVAVGRLGLRLNF